MLVHGGGPSSRPCNTLLRIVRTTTGPDGTVLEVNDPRMSADAFEVGYSVTRHHP